MPDYQRFNTKQFTPVGVVYFSESIHPVSFQTVQPEQGFFFLAVSYPAGSIAS